MTAIREWLRVLFPIPKPPESPEKIPPRHQTVSPIQVLEDRAREHDRYARYAEGSAEACQKEMEDCRALAASHRAAAAQCRVAAASLAPPTHYNQPMEPAP